VPANSRLCRSDRSKAPGGQREALQTAARSSALPRRCHPASGQRGRCGSRGCRCCSSRIAIVSRRPRATLAGRPERLSPGSVSGRLHPVEERSRCPVRGSPNGTALHARVEQLNRPYEDAAPSLHARVCPLLRLLGQSPFERHSRTLAQPCVGALDVPRGELHEGVWGWTHGGVDAGPVKPVRTEWPVPSRLGPIVRVDAEAC
jgi:hypothetical protein